MKHRNTILAIIQKHDCARLRTRTIEAEDRKLVKNRSRRNSEWKKQIRNINY